MWERECVVWFSVFVCVHISHVFCKGSMCILGSRCRHSDRQGAPVTCDFTKLDAEAECVYMYSVNLLVQRDSETECAAIICRIMSQASNAHRNTVVVYAVCLRGWAGNCRSTHTRLVDI